MTVYKKFAIYTHSELESGWINATWVSLCASLIWKLIDEVTKTKKQRTKKRNNYWDIGHT